MILFSILKPARKHNAQHARVAERDDGLPWAWSMVVLTVMVRLLMVPLAVEQIHSMQAMQAHMQ